MKAGVDADVWKKIEGIYCRITLASDWLVRDFSGRPKDGLQLYRRHVDTTDQELSSSPRILIIAPEPEGAD